LTTRVSRPPRPAMGMKTFLLTGCVLLACTLVFNSATGGSLRGGSHIQHRPRLLPTRGISGSPRHLSLRRAAPRRRQQSWAEAEGAPAEAPVAGSGRKKVMVVGASGRLGSRIVAELLRSGNSDVVAAVRSPEKLQSTMQDMARDGWFDASALKLLNPVQFDVETDSVASMANKIGNCDTVISAIGAAESNFFDVSAPARIDGDGSVALVDAAEKAGVDYFIMVTSLGTGKQMFTLPAGILNLFWGVLFQKAKAEKHLKKSTLDYTIIRPGGMERPGDDFKSISSQPPELQPRTSNLNPKTLTPTHPSSDTLTTSNATPRTPSPEVWFRVGRSLNWWLQLLRIRRRVSTCVMR
jgi:putative NADH-flavin reductase